VVRLSCATTAWAVAFLGAAVVVLSGCGGGGEGGQVGGGGQTREAAEGLPIRDDFQGECTWPQETTANDEVSCADGQYKVVITQAERLSFIPRRTQRGYRSISVGAKTTLLGQLRRDDLALQGVGCWASGRGEPALGYVFAVATLGEGRRYVIARQNEGDPDLQNNPLRMEVIVESDPVPSSGTPVDLRGECRKEGDSVQLALYVNGKRVAEATDTHDAPAIDAFGAYGLLAFTSKAGSDFRYDDFVAEELP
jgi:hypothetical protein